MTDTRPELKRQDRPPKEAECLLNSAGLYLCAIEPIFTQHLINIWDEPEAFLSQYLMVTKAQGLLFAAHTCIVEITNGGLHQFFSNPRHPCTGSHARFLFFRNDSGCTRVR